MKIPFSFGGGGGGDSDECTAVADDILEGKTAIYSGSNDEPAEGAMKDYSGTTQSAESSIDSSNSRIELKAPATGKYDTSSKLYASYSNLASLAGITGGIIATGSTILGITGTYTGVGTAAAAQVLSGYTFSNSTQSGVSGSMSDRSGSSTSVTATLDSSNSRVRMTIPNTGYYDTSAYLYTSYSSLASVISLTAVKIATGNTILGISGSYTGVGTATASQVLSGYTFSNSSSSGISGSMSDRSDTATSVTATLNSSSSQVRMTIPNNGYYNTSAYLYSSYSSLASTLGLSPSIIKKGETILGITGTWEGYVADANDLYYRGSVGSLGGTMRIYSDGITMNSDTNCITIDVYSGSNDRQYGGVTFGTAINFYYYDKLTLELDIITPSSSSGGYNVRYYGIGLFSSRPTSASGCVLTNAAYSAQAQDMNTAGSKTLTLDTSSITGSYYVAVVVMNNETSYTWTGEITRISVS